MNHSTSRRENPFTSDVYSLLLGDSEQIAVNQIIQLSHTSGFHVNLQSITNLFIGLKSKLLTLLVTPRKTGKNAAV